MGVHDSLAGLRALREAVGLARARGTALRAVRAYPPPRPEAVALHWQGGGLGPVSGKPWADPHLPWAAREQEAARFVAHAFEQAMGGIPDDIAVQTDTSPGQPGPVLVQAALGEENLLVLGASRRHWRPPRRSVGGYCAGRTGCPVLIVPQQAAARDLAGRTMQRVRRRRELSSLMADLTAHPSR